MVKINRVIVKLQPIPTCPDPYEQDKKIREVEFVRMDRSNIYGKQINLPRSPIFRFPMSGWKMV
jgi:hypothetical protein